MRRFSIILFAVSILFGFVHLSSAQVPDISGEWLFDFSGTFQGGGLITVSASGDFQGYGLIMEAGGKDGNGVLLSGHLAVDERGKITGTYTADIIEQGFPDAGEGNITGKVDKKVSKLSLKFENGWNGKAVKLPADPVVPSSWTATADHGKAVFALNISQITHDDDLALDFPHRMYSIRGTGKAEEGDVTFEGGFFLNSKNIGYGWYAAYDASVNLLEEGLFFGKVNLTPGNSSFSFKMTGYDPDDGSMSKAVLKGKAD
jgi:hypothetical protein